MRNLFVRNLFVATLWFGNLWVEPAVAEPVIALNPLDTEAVAHGKLHVRNLGGKACLNLTLLDADPVAPADQDAWIVHDGSDHRFCYRRAGENFCIEAIQTP